MLQCLIAVVDPALNDLIGKSCAPSGGGLVD